MGRIYIHLQTMLELSFLEDRVCAPDEFILSEHVDHASILVYQCVVLVDSPPEYTVALNENIRQAPGKDENCASEHRNEHDAREQNQCAFP